MLQPFALVLALVIPLAAAVSAEPPTVRTIPPPGVEISASDRAELRTGADRLAAEIARLPPASRHEWPNVEIFHKAVDWALRYGEFFDLNQVEIARDQLAQGMARLQALRDGKTPWNTATGLVVRGYRSKIDGSVQPYGMVVPQGWSPGDGKPRRLDFWFRGRAEKSTELAFIHERQHNFGDFAPPEVFVLHPFGRYCNANKFAGERDLFEAWEDARRHYPALMDRPVVRGFSMGGAACWQFATHFPAFWSAAAPGAGFAESREFLKIGTPQKPLPAEWEQTLWRWYDSTLHSANLANVPTIAYSGEKDGQKQAADIMERFLEQEGLTIPHVIGPDTAHKYHPDSKPRIEEFVTRAASTTSLGPLQSGRFVTYSLIYSELGPIRLQQLEKHWERAEVNFKWQTEEVEISTRNVVAFDLSSAAAKMARIDGQEISIPSEKSLRLAKTDGQWALSATSITSTATKRPGVCGPIDHAFMSSFVMVRPTGKALHDATGQWAASELEHATSFWRRVFRGDAPVRDDTEISDSDIAQSNLILWGDPQSNAVLARIADKLPVKWTPKGVEFNGQIYDAAHHMPALIFPNPLNPDRYIVLNSGVTFREQALLNNADQTPKLPDWAIIDIRTPAGPRWPGEIVKAGFFDEYWR